jgi:hypothetical protein
MAMTKPEKSFIYLGSSGINGEMIRLMRTSE